MTFLATIYKFIMGFSIFRKLSDFSAENRLDFRNIENLMMIFNVLAGKLAFVIFC